VVAIIVGFAGQNLFAGIIGGISIQINRPFKVGDWLKVGDTYGEVREINWRSTRFARTTTFISISPTTRW
jgi:small-conductance mechanosensitive channel